MLSNDDLIDMECLSSVERIGDPTDGCDVGRYARLGLIVKTDRYWTLTAEGRERLADLRAEAGNVGHAGHRLDKLLHSSWLESKR